MAHIKPADTFSRRQAQPAATLSLSRRQSVEGYWFWHFLWFVLTARG